MRITTLFLLFTPFLLRAGGPNVTPTTSEVTVYRTGAKLTSVATVKIPAGSSEVVFENLSPYFNSNSLQVTLKGNARLNAAVFRLKSPAPAPENPRARAIKDSLMLLGDATVAAGSEDKVLEDEAAMLKANSERVGTSASGLSSTLTVAELRELAEFYRQRMMDVRERQQKVAIRLRQIKLQCERLGKELVELQPNTANQTGEIVLKMDAAAAQSLEISCTYLVSAASWSPLYDLRSGGLSKPLQLVYKANVRNNTGFDWKGISLHLSTAQPLANNDRPVLNPVFIDFRPVAIYYGKNQMQQEPNVYQMQQVPNLASARSDVARALSEAAVPVSAEAAGEEDGEAGLTTTFDLPNPRDILSDGKDNIITVEEKEMPATYEYHAVPKLENGVFLLAKVAEYGQYNLLPGTANIFFQDTYVGQTWVNPQTTSDTLLLSLGRDEQLTIKRVQPKDFTERRKIFGSKIRETYQFEIAIKNNKTQAVTVEVLDQVPISKQKDITVDLQDKGGAKYNAEFGKLQWQVEVPAGQTKKVRFSYSVEYPKDQQVGYSKG